MRYLALYLRQCFCRHDFEREEAFYRHRGEFQTKDSIRISLLCEKCGYHRSFWKF